MLIESVGVKIASDSTVVEMLVSASKDVFMLQSRCTNGMQVPATAKDIEGNVQVVANGDFQLDIPNDGILIKVMNSSKSAVIAANGLRFKIAPRAVDHVGTVSGRTLGTDSYLDLFVDGAAELSSEVSMYVQTDIFECMHT